MGTRLNLKTPRDYLLHRDVCSYGYFLLAPNVWDPQLRTFTRPLDLDDGPATLTLTQTPRQARFADPRHGRPRAHPA